MVQASDSTASRWRTCLHEAGHAVVGRVLLGHTTRAAVFEDGWGVADVGDGGGVPTSPEAAITVAAGPAAEALADRFPPPEAAQVQPSPPLEARYPDRAASLKADLRTTMLDDVAIARWCIAGFESRPLRWTRQYEWVYQQADALIRRRRREIVSVAKRLFAEGLATLPVA